VSPESHIRGVSPIFPVGDMQRALDHYQALGFVTHAYEGAGDYGYADRDGVSLHLAGRHHEEPGGEGSEAYLFVDDADALYAEWTRPGIGGITRHVRDTPYALREGAHIDLDGNVIRFGSPLPARRQAHLQAHLETRYGIEVLGLSELDAGVFRVERPHGPAWVARRFPALRSVEAVAADAAILRFLAEHDYPAERTATTEPLSVLDGQAVLVTEYVDPVPRAQRRAAVRDAGGLRRLGELLGRLHTLPEGPEALSRPGGAWHHLADGGPRAEIDAAGTLLTRTDGFVAADQRRLYDALRAEVDTLDDGAGLPQALVHPDFVLANVVVSPDQGMVLVDWAGAGRGPRVWPLAWLLFAEGAKDLRRIDLIAAGYRRHVDLEPEELSRLEALARVRWVILKSWEFCMGHRTLADTTREITEAHALAAAVGSRAQAAFASTGTA
jgi:Ser/Thr protein kinase RdoA (MazF antagonist)